MSETWVATCAELNRLFFESVGIELGTMLVRIGEYGDAANALVADIEAKRECAQAWLDDLQEALSDYEHAGDGEPSLVSNAGAVRDAVSVLTGDLARTRDTIQATANAAIADLDQLTAGLAQAAQEVATARSDSATRLEVTASVLHGVEGSLVDAGGQTGGVVLALQTATEEAAQAAHEAAHEIQERVQLIAQKAPDRVRDTAANCALIVQTMLAGTRDAFDGLQEEVEPLVDALTDDARQAGERMAPAVGRLETSAETLRDLLAGVAERLAEDRATLSADHAAVVEALGPADNLVGYGRDTAEIMGISWENPQ